MADVATQTVERARDELNWNLLRNFFVIAESRSITKGAQVLGISQPSASSALRKLEAQLGCQLVFRDSRSFELTLRGHKVFLECAELFRGVDRITELARGATEEERGEVHFQIISHLVSPIVDEVLRLFHQRYPSVSLRIDVANSQDILNEIEAGTLAIGFCLLSKPRLNLSTKLLFREEFRVFCGAEHPLFGCEKVGLRELRQEPFIAFSCANDGGGLEPMAVLQDGARLAGRIAGVSSNLREVRRMIMAGIGIGVLPVLSVEDDVRKGALWPLTIEGVSLGADVYLVNAAPELLTSAERRFLQLAEELLALYPELS